MRRALTPSSNRERTAKVREWDGETRLGSPRREAAALAALVRAGRATAQDLREALSLPPISNWSQLEPILDTIYHSTLPLLNGKPGSCFSNSG